MQVHHCHRCSGLSASIREANSEIVYLLRIAEKRPGAQHAINARARVPELKERVASSRRWLKEHLEEISA